MHVSVFVPLAQQKQYKLLHGMLYFMSLTQSSKRMTILVSEVVHFSFPFSYEVLMGPREIDCFM